MNGFNYCQKCSNKDKHIEILEKLHPYNDIQQYVYFEDKDEFKDMLRLSLIYSEYLQKYEYNHSNLLKRVFLSKFNFAPIVYYILDIKFHTWSGFIKELYYGLQLFYIIHKRSNVPCLYQKQILNDLLEKYKNVYEEKLLKIKEKIDDKQIDGQILNIFLNTHMYLYKKFKEISNSIWEKSNKLLTIDDIIYFYTNTIDLLIFALELTVVEVLSINRLLVDKTCYVSYSMYKLYTEYKFNFLQIIYSEVNKFKKIDKNDIKLIPTSNTCEMLMKCIQLL